MHCRVLPSPCSSPMPNLPRAPSRAISSMGIWPVLRKATDSLPCFAWMPFMRFTKASRAVGQSTARSRPPASLNMGEAARSGAPSGVSASQPLGQAMPRLTGCWLVGDRLTTCSFLKWTSRLQPTEQ